MIREVTGLCEFPHAEALGAVVRARDVVAEARALRAKDCATTTIGVARPLPYGPTRQPREDAVEDQRKKR